MNTKCVIEIPDRGVFGPFASRKSAEGALSYRGWLLSIRSKSRGGNYWYLPGEITRFTIGMEAFVKEMGAKEIDRLQSPKKIPRANRRPR